MFNPLVANVIAVAVGLVAAAAVPRRTREWLCVAFARFAHLHPVGSIAGLAALIVVVRLCCLPLVGVPVPVIPDENSYLFLARTLALGRLSNPVHPMWRHFQTLFILHQPAYASVYPPMQGVILVFGRLLSGEPWIGVLLSITALCVASSWMLRAYTTRAWALYGGVLAGAAFGILSYWVNSYWGGAAAATGGALVFGALPRMVSKRRARDAAVLGLGLFMLANSRPYEGFLTALPVTLCVIRHLGKGILRDRAVRMQALVLASLIISGAALTGWYNWRVTGSPFLLPHVTYMRQYAAAPAFLWQHPRNAPEYADRVLRDAHVSFGIDYADQASFADGIRKAWGKLARIALFYWGPWWALAVLYGPEFIRERRFRVLAFSAGLCITGVLLTVGFQVHYAAPCTAIFLLMLVDAFRRLWNYLKPLATVVIIASPLAWIGSEALNSQMPPSPHSLLERRFAEDSISSQRGGHVVIVRYGPLHPLSEEWVLNGPDIDEQRVIWARDLGEAMNRELFRYYRERTFWMVEPDHPAPRIVRLPSD